MFNLLNTDSITLRSKAISLIASQNDIKGYEIYSFSFIDQKQDIIISHRSDSFFGDLRITVVNDCDSLFKAKKLGKDDLLFLNDLVSNTKNILIFVSSYDKYRTNIEEKINAPISELDFKSPLKENLKSFITNKLKKENIKITSDALKLLIQLTNENFDKVIQELNKFKLLNKDIDVDFVKKVVVDNLESPVFKILSSILNKKVEEFLKDFDILKEKGTNPIMFLQLMINEIYQIHKFKKLAIVKTKREIEEGEKITSYRLNKLLSAGKGFTFESLLDIMKFLLETERLIKANNPINPMQVLKGRLYYLVN